MTIMLPLEILTTSFIKRLHLFLQLDRFGSRSLVRLSGQHLGYFVGIPQALVGHLRLSYSLEPRILGV